MPLNVQVIAFGAMPVDPATVQVTVTGVDTVGLVPLGCCALRLDFAAQPGELGIEVLGQGTWEAGAYQVDEEEDHTPPAPPVGLTLDPPSRVPFVDVPMEGYGAPGVHLWATYQVAEDVEYVVVLGDDGTELGFPPAYPNTNPVLWGLALADDEDTVCLRVLGVDAAGNRSLLSERVCATVEPPAPPDPPAPTVPFLCACLSGSTGSWRGAAAGAALALLALAFARRR